MFRPADFDKLTIKVMDQSTPPSANPFFNKHQCFQERIDGIKQDDLIRYIVLFYDPRSPILDKFTDHVERKKCAATLGGFKSYPDGSWSKAVNGVLYCDNRTVIECIIEYLRYLKNPDWAFLCAAWEAYYQILTEMMSEAVSLGGKAGTKTSVDIASSRAVLSEKANKMAQDLSDRTMKFLAMDESPYLKKGLFDMIESKRKLDALTAERQAFGSEYASS